MFISVERMASPRCGSRCRRAARPCRLRVRSPADDQQHHRHGDLRHDQPVAERPAPAAGARGRRRRPSARSPDSAASHCSAGARPATSAASIVTPAVNSSTRASMRSANDSGIGIGSGDRHGEPRHRPGEGDAGRARRATPSPTLSDEQLLDEPARGWRRWPGGCRSLSAGPDARASSMLATFAHAISSTRPTTSIRPRPIGSSARSATGWMCTSVRRHGADVEALVRRLVVGLQPLADQGQVRGGSVERRVRLQPAFDEHPPLPAPLEPRVAGRRRHRADDAARLDLVDVRHRRPEFGREQRHHAGERRAARRRRSCTAGRGSGSSGRRPTALAPYSRFQRRVRDDHDARRAGADRPRAAACGPTTGVTPSS